MPTRPAHSCTQRMPTEALARGELGGGERDQAEKHLEHCQACRAVFRQRTASRFPKIRNYTILTEVGRGGFGVVYKALHHSKERSEALKVLFGSTEQRTAYFENEVRLVAKLHHPNIATLYDASLSTTPLFYTMEFVQGQQLDEYLRTSDLSLEQRIELIKSVISAIGYAHAQGVIHRDLKPQNILIDPQGQPRIIDFGIAKRLGLTEPARTSSDDSGPHGEGALGTYGYISPEQLAGQEVDARADIFGLGALLFHVITGQPARFAPQVERLTEVLRERQVSRAADLAAIIACCVHPLPEQRYESCESLAADLDSYLAGRPIRARQGVTPGYHVARIAALVFRNYPLTVHVATTVVVAGLLTLCFWIAGIQWQLPGRPANQTALIAFTPSTLAALQSGKIGADVLGLDAGNKKSYRLLYGRLMEKLAAAQPRVVVWDYFFPDCQPAFDAGFIRGVQAVGAPVVVGTPSFDENGDPLLCPDIRAVVHGWGTLHSTRPGDFGNEIYVPLATQSGFNSPAPSLALAGSAAARHPDYEVDVRGSATGLELRYRKKRMGPGERRWHAETETVPVVKIERAEAGEPLAKPGEHMWFGRFPFADTSTATRDIVPMEAALTADAAELRGWFGGRAVLVGQMLPDMDEHQLKGDSRVFGCQIQATVLNDVLTHAGFTRLNAPELPALIFASCVLAAVGVYLCPTSGVYARRYVGLVAGVMLVLALAGAVALPRVLVTRWSTGVAVAACALVATGAATLLVKLLHQRQLHLTPGPIWSADGTTDSATVLSTTRTNSPA